MSSPRRCRSSSARMGWIRFSMMVMFSLGLQLESAAGDKKSPKQHHKLLNHDDDVMEIEVDALSSPTVSKDKYDMGDIGTYGDVSQLSHKSSNSIPDHINEQDVYHEKLVKEQEAKSSRSIPPPPQLLPIFERKRPVSFRPGTQDHQTYWWNEALRERIEYYKAIKLESGFINNNAPHRYQLNPVELHVVKDFLNEKERIKVE
jgi:hypothetical protein